MADYIDPDEKWSDEVYVRYGLAEPLDWTDEWWKDSGAWRW